MRISLAEDNTERSTACILAYSLTVTIVKQSALPFCTDPFADVFAALPQGVLSKNAFGKENDAQVWEVNNSTLKAAIEDFFLYSSVGICI